MRCGTLAAVAALLAVAAGARADEAGRGAPPSRAGIVLRDAVAGGLLGSAVSGGIIVYNMSVEEKTDYDWGRTLAWGAAIGFGAGLVAGFIETATRSDLAVSRAPVRDGMSSTLDLRAVDQSGAQVFHVVSRGF